MKEMEGESAGPTQSPGDEDLRNYVRVQRIALRVAAYWVPDLYK